MNNIENVCLECKEVCCVDFMIWGELKNPNMVQTLLERYPFIRQTGKKLVFYGSSERVVGVYNCDRFDRRTGLCRDYNTLERPDFCINSGVIFEPHKGCRLYKILHQVR